MLTSARLEEILEVARHIVGAKHAPPKAGKPQIRVRLSKAEREKAEKMEAWLEAMFEALEQMPHLKPRLWVVEKERP